jgi:hypothetical protein
MPYIRIIKDLPNLFLRKDDEVYVPTIYDTGGTVYTNSYKQTRYIFSDEFEVLPNKPIEYHI